MSRDRVVLNKAANEAKKPSSYMLVFSFKIYFFRKKHAEFNEIFNLDDFGAVMLVLDKLPLLKPCLLPLISNLCNVYNNKNKKRVRLQYQLVLSFVYLPYRCQTLLSLFLQ